jgi:hypothetical protein
MSNGQRWSSEDFVLLRYVLESLADLKVHVIGCMCSAQSGKTVTLQLAVCYWIAEDPGPTLWVTSSKEKAREEMKGRLKVVFRSCPPVAERMPEHRSLNTNKDIYFPGGEFRITGCESEADLQTTPYRRLVLDEGRTYPKHAMPMVAKRTRSFPHSFKRVSISTPDLENDDVHASFLEGDQRIWEFECDKCGHFQELRWGEDGVRGGVKWDVNEVTKPEGRWNYDAVYKTVRYECEACDREWREIGPSQRDRVMFATKGRIRILNPDAPADHHSYRWQALLPPYTSWLDQLHELLEARVAMAHGDIEKYKDWVNETDGKPWAERMRYQDDEKMLWKRCADYDPLAPWDEEVYRFMTVDVQGAGGRHFWIVVRAWARGGWSRKLWAGRMFTWDELDEVQRKWNVHPIHVIIDAAKWSAEIYLQIMKRGYTWKAAKGEDVTHFRGEQNGQKVRRIWDVSPVDPMMGKAVQGRRPRPIPLIRFSKPTTVNMLLDFLAGAVGRWEVPHKDLVSSDYATQVTAYEVRLEVDGRGVQRQRIYVKRNNHLADCERMQILAAACANLLAGEDPQEIQEELLSPLEG